MRNASATSSSASMRPVSVTGTPASRFSVVMVRTGRACGAAASTSGWHAANDSNRADNATRRRRHAAFTAPTRPDIAEPAMFGAIYGGLSLGTSTLSFQVGADAILMTLGPSRPLAVLHLRIAPLVQSAISGVIADI